MPLNFQPERVDPASLLTNQRSIDRHLAFDHYVRPFQPGDFVLSGTTAEIIPAATPRWPCVTFPEALATEAAVSWERPSEWRSGALAVWVRYTSPVGSTNTFRCAITVNAGRLAEVLPATTLYNVFANWPGPAVADTWMEFGPIYTTTAFGADDQSFSLKIRRAGTDAVNDTNVNALNVLLVRVEHIPANAEGQ
jgi:hypothetical protein